MNIKKYLYESSLLPDEGEHIEDDPSLDKIPAMVSSFTTGLSRLSFYLKRARNIGQYQFAFTLAYELLKNANTIQKANQVWKVIADSYSSRFVKE